MPASFLDVLLLLFSMEGDNPFIEGACTRRVKDRQRQIDVLACDKYL